MRITQPPVIDGSWKLLSSDHECGKMPKPQDIVEDEI